jgi:integrase
MCHHKLGCRSGKSVGDTASHRAQFTGASSVRVLCGVMQRCRKLTQCRHTYATLLLRAGEEMRFVASQMGHTTLAMLIRHYALEPPLTRRRERHQQRAGSLGLVKNARILPENGFGRRCTVQAGGWKKP